MYYVRYPLSFRQVKDILHERGTLRCDRLCLTTPPYITILSKMLHFDQRCAQKLLLR